MSIEAPAPKAKKKFTIVHLFLILVGFSIFICLCLIAVANTGNGKTKTPTTVAQVSTATSTLSPTQTPTPENTATPTITQTSTQIAQISVGNNANVRSGPGLGFSVVKVIKPDETAQVYGRSEDGQWFWIDPEEQDWIHVSVSTLSVPAESLPLAPTMTPTVGPSPTSTPTPRPSPTPVPPIRLEEIYYNFQTMTSLQFSDYKQEIAGKPLDEMIVVGGVQDDGKVVVSGDWSPFLFNVSEFCVVVAGVPKETAITLNAGDRVYLHATINRIVGDYNYYYNCENTLVLSFKRFGED